MRSGIGDSVLVRGVVGPYGIMLGPGVEVREGSLEIVSDIPVFDQPQQPVALVMFFASEIEREEFARRMEDEPGIETRAV